MDNTKKLILASTSRSRRTLLERAGVQFEVVPSDYEEDMTLPLEPHEMVKEFSQGKAQAVTKHRPGAIIVGADSVAVLKGKALGKPKDEAEARAMLKRLSGAKFIFLTGFTVINSATGEEITDTEEVAVHIKELSDSEIDTYIASGEPLAGHAGAFAAQGKGAVIIERIEGDVTALMGLPLCRLNTITQKWGFSLLV
ncbi:MAG: nucleoside triphosphate pyrophosphatase [Candidatus Andersenbacteria bacterium]